MTMIVDVIKFIRKNWKLSGAILLGILLSISISYNLYLSWQLEKEMSAHKDTKNTVAILTSENRAYELKFELQTEFSSIANQYITDVFGILANRDSLHNQRETIMREAELVDADTRPVPKKKAVSDETRKRGLTFINSIRH